MTRRSRTAPVRRAARAVEVLEGRVLLASPAGFRDSTYASGLSSPTAMTFAPDGRLFVTQQGGQLRVVSPGAAGGGAGTLLATPFLTVPTSADGERGLLSVEFDPEFMSNGYVYVYYTSSTPAAHNRVSRFTAVDADPGPGYRPGNTAAAGSEFVLLDLNNLSSATNHNGGAMHFGPDGRLYIAVGENANGSNAQTLSNLLGKVLRINRDGTIPTDNPFYTVATGNNRAIWSLGLRNPYTFSFQPTTTRMFINDVGQSTWEEVNDGIAGSNYGWPGIEGFRTNQALPTIGTYRDPVAVYSHASGGIAITGGAFYNPPVTNFPAQYVGEYFFSDYGAGFIKYIDPSLARPAIQNFSTGINSPVDLDVGPDGALYYLSIFGGTVGRISWGAPRITAQPQPVTVNEGAPAPFSVTATGESTLSYQWLRNDQPITGATGPTYTLPNTTAGDSGATFRVRVTNSFGSVISDPATLTVTAQAAEVVGRWVFYNNSAFDGRNAAIDDNDDKAIATDKQALLPGQLASFSNVTSYSRGINGIMLDVAHLPATATITAGNFTFATGKGDGTWEGGVTPTSVTATPRRGAGVNGSDRIEVTFADGAVHDQWLRVTFTPTSGIGGAAPINTDTFYFGNLRGEIGDAGPTLSGPLRVNAFDVTRTRQALAARAVPVTNAFDFNRDQRVNVLDYSITLRSQGRSLALFAAPPPPAGASTALNTLRRVTVRSALLGTAV